MHYDIDLFARTICENNAVTIQTLQTGLNRNVAATQPSQKLAGNGRMRRQQLVIRAGQAIIFHIPDRARDNTLAEPAGNTGWHPGGHNSFVGWFTVQIFR